MEDILISLTEFTDFVLSAGTPRLTLVERIQNYGDYRYRHDFYREFRDGVIDYHRQGHTDKRLLNGIIDGIGEQKLIRFSENIAGYKKFLGRKEISWFEPPRGIWKYDRLKIKLNPELGLVIDGSPFVIKCYQKTSSIYRNRIEVVLALLQEQLVQPVAQVGVLDVVRGRLHVGSVEHDTRISKLLHAEATSFLTLWDQLYGYRPDLAV